MTLRTALIIDGDSAGGQKALADLNRSIAQTEQQTAKIGASSGAAAMQAAAAAQTAAAAVTRQSGSYATLTRDVTGNTVAMRESLVVTRELLNGNLTRLPGSLSILGQQYAASGKSAGDWAKQLLTSYGVIQVAQDEELAASARSAAATAEAVAATARRAESSIIAADAEVLLAEAAVRAAAGTDGETAAQARLAAAHQAVAVAAAEAEVAEGALAVAEGAAGEAAVAAGAEATVGLGPIGVALAIAAVAALPLIEAFKSIKAEADRAKLDEYAASAHLSATETAALNDDVVKLVEGLQKSADKARDSVLANKIWATSIDGVREAQQKLRDEIDRTILSEQALNQIHLDQAQSRLGTLSTQLADAKKAFADLGGDKAIADIQKSLASPTLTAGQSPEAAQSTRAAIEAELATLRDAKTKIDDINAGIEESNAAIRTASIPIARDWANGIANASLAYKGLFANVTSGVELLSEQKGAVGDAVAGNLASLETALKQASAAGDRAASAGAKVDGLGKKVSDLWKALRAGSTSPADFVRGINDMTKSLNAAAKAAEDAKKSMSGGFGRQIDFAGAEAIAKGAGLTVTSSYRPAFGHGTPGHQTQEDLYNNPAYNHPGNPVARPGTSAHNGINGKWALDIAFAPGLTAQSLKKLYGNEGVSLTAVYKESGHFHIEGSRSQAAASERADTRDADKERDREAAYQQEKDAAEQQVIDARKGLATSAQDQWGFEVAATIAAHNKTADLISAQQAAGKLLPQEAATLKSINDEHEKYLNQLADQRLAEAQSADQALRNQNAVTVETGLLGAQQDLLQSQLGLARTASDRKALQDKLIDLQFTEERIQLQSIVAEADRLKALADTTKNQQDIANATKAEADAAVAKAKLAGLPAEQANAHQDNQNQNASPLEAWASQIPQGAKEIGAALESDAVKGINDFNDGLAEAIVKGNSLKDVFHSLAEQMLQDLIKLALQEAELYALKAIFGSAFGGARAAGGPVEAGTPYLVGERGMEIFVPSSNGSIIPNHQLKTGNMRAANDGGAPNVTLAISNDFRGAAPEAVAQIRARLDQMERDLPGRVISTMQDARQRFLWR